ncbi:MAG: hypothetical protein BJ554DRAFT_7869, partial [Olpidium bornovanus]
MEGSGTGERQAVTFYRRPGLGKDGKRVTIVLPEDSARPTPKRAPREFRVKMRWVSEVNMAELGDYLQGKAQLNNNSENITSPPSMFEAVIAVMYLFYAGTCWFLCSSYGDYGSGHSAPQLNGLHDRQHKQLERACRNIRICVTHRGERRPQYKITKLSREPASQLTFED